MNPRLFLLSAVVVSLLALPCMAAPDPGLRKIPPPGIAVPDPVRAELTSGVALLGAQIEAIRFALADNQKALALLPDVEIFHKAVDWALRYDEFFDAKQFDIARKQLAMGAERADALMDGRSPWTQQTGLVVRGYRSKIDGSVQPYGLVIPEGWKADPAKPTRLDFWLHGRGEKLSELSFIDDRTRNRGEFTPDGTIVLHLYERFCNANKFAGELDLFEAWNSVKSQYPIDAQRVNVRGFSMGGASCWQYATHHAGLWAATAPGAGFAETAEFFHSFDEGKTPPPWYEQVLWRWYDCTLYANNLFNTTTVAYAGELDKQKQSSDIMAKYLEKEGLSLTTIIGPNVPHKYAPESKPKIEELITTAAVKGSDPYPPEVRFTTYTLIYSHMKWVAVEGMEKEWERADVTAKVKGDTIEVTTKNVSALRFRAPVAGDAAADSLKKFVIDGEALPAAWEKKEIRFHKDGGKWKAGAFAATGLHKKPGLCGPIDHALMSSFVMVKPTGKPMNDTVGAWTTSELAHASDFWRAVYRGDARVIDDKALTDAEIKNSNLILWGDPSSNSVLAKIADKLPIQWGKNEIKVGKTTYPSANCVPILVFPNPLNPEKYVVLNSSVTYREQALLNNSDQTPKLPDWAIVDLKTPPDAKWLGLVLDAGFFDENWKLQ